MSPALSAVAANPGVDALTDVQSRLLAVQARIAAITGQPVGGSSSAATGVSTSKTFASTLAQAQSVLSSSGTSSTGAATGDSIVADSLKYLGVPYQWGGTDPDTGLDCSGLVQKVMSDNGITVPRTAAEQASVGTEVPSLAQAQPGDLVVLDGGSHIGIYVGNGQMIHAPKAGDVVKISKVWETPMTIRRMTSPATTDSSTAMSSYLRSALLGGSSSSSLSSALGLGSGDGDLLEGLNLSNVDISSLLGQTASTGSSGLSGSAGSTAGVSSYQSLFDAATAKYNLPDGLLASVAQVESGGDATAVSPAGAQGLMQLMPGTAASLGVDASKPSQAVDGAARLLAGHLKTYGSVPLALAAYNAGPGNVTKYGGIPPFAETQAYVRKVSALMARSSS